LPHEKPQERQIVHRLERLVLPLDEEQRAICPLRLKSVLPGPDQELVRLPGHRLARLLGLPFHHPALGGHVASAKPEFGLVPSVVVQAGILEAQRPRIIRSCHGLLVSSLLVFLSPLSISYAIWKSVSFTFVVSRTDLDGLYCFSPCFRTYSENPVFFGR
jgi:hypothetical protein